MSVLVGHQLHITLNLLSASVKDVQRVWNIPRIVSLKLCYKQPVQYSYRRYKHAVLESSKMKFLFRY